MLLPQLGFRQTISRSPGKSGPVTPVTAPGPGASGTSGARVPGPEERGSLRMPLDFSTEIASSPARSRSSRVCAVVSILLSPASAMRPKRERFPEVRAVPDTDQGTSAALKRAFDADPVGDRAAERHLSEDRRARRMRPRDGHGD